MNDELRAPLVVTVNVPKTQQEKDYEEISNLILKKVVEPIRMQQVGDQSANVVLNMLRGIHSHLRHQGVITENLYHHNEFISYEDLKSELKNSEYRIEKLGNELEKERKFKLIRKNELEELRKKIINLGEQTRRRL